MQDDLPDLPPSPDVASAKSGPKPKFKINLGPKLVLITCLGLLLILGIAASVLEKIAPRGGVKTRSEQLLTSSLWQIQPQPGQIIFGFYLDDNKNNQFDYREKPFDKVSVAIRRFGETEPFRRVAAGTDGLAKIDNLGKGDYEVSYDNYSTPDSETDQWLWFDQYQKAGEFLPTAWQKITLADSGVKELVGLNHYQPPFLLALATDSGLSWYDPARPHEYAKSNLAAPPPGGFVSRGQDIFYLQDGKLEKLSWQDRTSTEELIWLDQVANWSLSPQGKTVSYSLDNGEMQWRSTDENCTEGGLLFDGVRLKVKTSSFTDETAWLVVARGDDTQPWQAFKVNCNQIDPLATVAEPVNIGSLASGDWFYSTNEATYFVDGSGKTVKYTALGGGEGISVSQDKRYLIKKLASGNYLVVDYPSVKTSGVEKHYLITGIVGGPTIIGDNVYYVRSKPCEADGDCGEVVQINLQGSGVWSVGNTWDLKNVPAKAVVGVVTD